MIKKFITLSKLKTQLINFKTIILDPTYVKKDGTKVLSDTNFTNIEKSKLASLENYDDTEIKSDINGLKENVKLIPSKVDKEDGKGLSSNDYTTEEKNKLAKLNNYDDSTLSAQILSIKSSIGNISSLAVNSLTNIIDAINHVFSVCLKSITCSNKKLVISYRNNESVDVDLSPVIANSNLEDLNNILQLKDEDNNNISPSNGQVLKYDSTANKWAPGDIGLENKVDNFSLLNSTTQFSSSDSIIISHENNVYKGTLSDIIKAVTQNSVKGNTNLPVSDKAVNDALTEYDKKIVVVELTNLKITNGVLKINNPTGVNFDDYYLPFVVCIYSITSDHAGTSLVVQEASDASIYVYCRNGTSYATGTIDLNLMYVKK